MVSMWHCGTDPGQAGPAAQGTARTRPEIKLEWTLGNDAGSSALARGPPHGRSDLPGMEERCKVWCLARAFWLRPLAVGVCSDWSGPGLLHPSRTPDRWTVPLGAYQFFGAAQIPDRGLPDEQTRRNPDWLPVEMFCLWYPARICGYSEWESR